MPIDRSSISHFRARVNVGDLDKILQESLAVAHRSCALNASDVTIVSVDTTVQSKAVDGQSQSKLLLDAIIDIGRSAKKAGLKLKQNYRFIAKDLAWKASGYAHESQGGHFILSSRALHGRPYEGYTLNSTIENISQINGATPGKIYIYKGYKGHDYPNKADVFKSGQKRGVIDRIKREL